MSTWGFAPVAGEVLLVGSAPLDVRRPVTLSTASVEVTSGQVELLAARVTSGPAAFTGSGCSTGTWPPPGFGPSEPLAGYTVAPGDRVSVLVYLRARTPAAAASAITVAYREHGRRETVRLGNERVTVEPATSGHGDGCKGSIWFGGNDDPPPPLT